ncbi:MAG: choloylglycine hydrolase [Clostridia bacterium]|nr:choloylglycine hydrolase [Clostridia bacterium]
MCTAATYKTDNFYFGRTLDNEFSFGETVTVTPRNFPLKFRFLNANKSHFAIIGMAYVCENYPLYYDAMNEKGLCMAGLNFVGNAYFNEPQHGEENVAVFEFIPWILSQCANVTEVRERLGKINLVNEPFSKDLPVAQLHWMIADKDECITVEAVKDGLKIYDNPVGVLTNNPPFSEQMFNLNNYMHLSPKAPENTFSKSLDLKYYSKGMGTIGLPGDLSSMSRFVRVAFVKQNSVSEQNEASSVSQFFHILNSVDQPRGCNVADRDMYEITVYTSCCNASKGIYYYTTYDNHQISAVDMFRENLDSCKLKCYPLIMDEQINRQN